MDRREEGVNFDGWREMDPQNFTSNVDNENEELGHEYDGVLGQDDRSAFEELRYDDSGSNFAFDISEGSDYEFDGPRVPTGQDTEKEEERKEIEKQIEKFKKDYNKISEHLNAIKASITLGTEMDYAVSAIRQLDSELRVLDEFAQELIGRMDEFKSKYENADFSLSYKEMVKDLQSIKDDLRTIKRLQIENYNYTVEATNQAIENLRVYDNPEINEFLDSLPALGICNANITRWDANIAYLNDMNYEALRDVNRRLTEFMVNRLNDILNNAQNRTTDPSDGTVEPNSDPAEPNGDPSSSDEEKKEELNDKSTWSMLTWDLYNRMIDIEAKIAELEEAIEKVTTLEELNKLREKMTEVSQLVVEFSTKLTVNKEELGEEVYNELYERYELCLDDLYELNGKLDVKGNELAEETNKLYNDLKKRLEFLTHEKDYLRLMVNSLYSKTNVATVEELMKNVANLSNKLGEFEQDVKQALDEGKIDNNQYEQLMKNINELKPELEEINNKLKDPGMYKDVDIYTILNGDIDGIEHAIEMLDKDVEAREKPIKRADRKELDQKFKAIEKEINRLEKTLNQYKDKDPEKYEATMNRLNDAKAKLEKVGKKYRSKCPLLVKGVKSAKAFFKKHKKVCLIIAGLAAFALVSHQVLIPAIMHGNIMIASTTPTLRGFSKFMNGVLGSLIGATKTTDGLWMLSSGVIINPAAGTSSLLKGLAVSGVSSSLFVGPVVVAITKLVEKMKTVELKKKLSEGKEKLASEKDKLSGKMKDAKNKASKKRNNGKADRMTSDYFAELYYNFKKSGKSIDEFCEENGLSEDEKTFLNIYHNKQQQFVDEVATNRSSRRSH